MGNSKQRKAWLTAKEQVERLKSKGVRFKLISEQEAVEYLEQNNNYFRLGSYRSNFLQIAEGPRAGQYQNLDFKMMIDLSIIDMLLRNTILPMTLDIEHFSKVKLMQRIESEGEDGYAIVRDFLVSCNNDSDIKSSKIVIEISKGTRSPYLTELISKYPECDYPVWVFMELIPFGQFVQFYMFCAKRFQDRMMKNEFYMLMKVKSLRNACAHNNCLLNNITKQSSEYKASQIVTKALGYVKGIGVSQRKLKMKIPLFAELATTLYLHQQLASEGVKEHKADDLFALKQRMYKHIDYYESNDQIIFGFGFIAALIDAWYPKSGNRD